MYDRLLRSSENRLFIATNKVSRTAYNSQPTALLSPIKYLLPNGEWPVRGALTTIREIGPESGNRV